MTNPRNIDESDLKQLVERSVEDIYDLARRGLSFHVDEIRIAGTRPTILTLNATLHFRDSGSPFCCSEPGCHMGFSDTSLAQMGEWIRLAIGYRYELRLEFGDRVEVDQDDGVQFGVS